MNPFFVLFVLSWIVVAFFGALFATTIHIVFGSLSYAEGKYALVIAALGIAATVEVFGFNLRRWFKALAAVVLLSLAIHSSSARAGPFTRTGEIVDINDDRGGNLGDYQARFKGYRDRGVRVRVKGVCGSGCTLVTRLPEKDVCVTTHARLVFHQANDLAPGVPNWLATKYLMDQYPDWVRARIASTGRGVLGPGLMVMGTADLTKHYAICSNGTVARK